MSAGLLALGFDTPGVQSFAVVAYYLDGVWLVAGQCYIGCQHKPFFWHGGDQRFFLYLEPISIALPALALSPLPVRTSYLSKGTYRYTYRPVA